MPRAVLLLTDRYPPHPGGLARSSQRLANHAARAGASVHVLVTRCEGAPGSVASTAEGAIGVHRLGSARDAAENAMHAVQALEWLHAGERFDLFHGQYGSTGGFLAAYQARRLGAASYVSLRGNDLDRDAHDPARFPHLLWALQHAGAVGGVSRALVRSAAALSGRDDVRFTPNSVDGERFRPLPGALWAADLRASLGLDGGPVLLFAGELRAKKGAAFLLPAFREVAMETGAQLLLAGTVRAEERRAMDLFLAEEPALAERVRRCPYVHDEEQLARIYNLADVVLCPSLWEGMPNAVLEAMACARPVLASDAGGIPDLMAHGETGWLMSRHQLHRLGEALREVLALSPEERARVGARARKWVLAEFSPEREREELLEGYAAAVGALQTTAGPPPNQFDGYSA